MDERIGKYIDAARKLKQGDYQVDVPVTPFDEVGQLGQALQELAISLDKRYQELRTLNQITVKINSGILLDQILDDVYRDFRHLIPYNRIGFSLLEEGGKILRARWAKTDRRRMRLTTGFTGEMPGSSLQALLETRQPRILNDLPDYLSKKPESVATRLIVEEGYLSSLTCPLVANGVAVGFMFFSSVERNTYSDAHVELYSQIADQLSVIVEKGRLVSELAEKSARIQQQNEELIRLDNLKNFFLGMAAHDLRNPIANIQLMSEVMLGQNLGPTTAEEDREFIQDINQQARFMTGLLTDILSVAEIESGKMQLNPTSIDLSTFLSESIKRQSRLGHPKGSQVVIDGEPAGKLKADPQRLRQVLDNLISNGLKYSPANSTIRVKVMHGEGAWRFEVQDEGPGLQEKDHDQLFKDFARLSARPTSGERSTGLGLSIARRLVEVMGGQIGAEPAPGKGSIFWFTLPE
jgi:signal transduction histidine kinase